MQASPSITQRHIPLTRGKPVTPNRDIQASQPRVVPGHRDMEGGKTVRARMPEVSDSRNRDAAGAAYPLPVHVTVDAHQPSAQHPPPTLHATRGRRDTGSGAASRAGPAPEPQEGHRRPTLPAKTASWSEGVHAAASRRAASPRREEDAHVGLRSRRSPPVSPAVQALSHSDGSLERRNSMSHSMKPVWELQEAHLSGSLEPEPFFHHFHDHQSDLDEAILLSVQSLHQPGHDSDESHGDDDDGGLLCCSRLFVGRVRVCAEMHSTHPSPVPAFAAPDVMPRQDWTITKKAPPLRPSVPRGRPRSLRATP